MKEKFNAEACLKDVNTAIENQINALRSTEMGPLRTLASTTKHRFKLNKAVLGLTQALNVESKGKGPAALLNELAAKVEEQKVPGAERLKQLLTWSHDFWSQADVKLADAGNHVRTLKRLAQKMPNP